MNALTYIYLVGALGIGFLTGLVTELMIEGKQIADLQENNRKLELENEQLRNEAKHEVIEIIDNNINPANVPDFGGF